MSKKKPGVYSNLLSLDNEVQRRPKPPLKKLNVASKIESSTGNRSRSISPKNKKMKPSTPKAPVEVIDWDIPDRQFGDLYCKPCDSHMNSENMWTAHIQGKRHLKNVKKGESGGGGDLKYDYVEEDPIMIDLLNAETRSIVGLQHVVEIRRLELPPIYQCFLCSANLATAEFLLDHCVGTKHRMTYLKEHDPDRYQLVKNSNLKKGHIEPVVEECIQKHEANIGRGKMLVKRERADYQSPPRNYKSDYGKAKSTRSNRSPDREPKKFQRDRSFDSFDGNSSQGRFADNSYYNRSDDFAEHYKRLDYNNSESSKFNDSSRFPPGDMHGRSPDNKYGSSRSVAEDRYASSRGSIADDRYGNSRPSVDDDMNGSSRPVADDSRYGNSRPSVADDRYGSSRPVADDSRYGNSRSVVAEDRYGRPMVEEEKRYRTSLDEDRYGDLRQVLEKKKTSTETYRQDIGASYAMSDSYHGSEAASSFSAIKVENRYSNALGSNTTSTGKTNLAEMISNIPDTYLKLIEAMTPTVFLQLALFKMTRIEVKSDLELQLLDKLSSATTSLSLELKQNQLNACPSELKEKFKESMVMHGLGVTPQFSKDYQKIIEMVGQAKAMSSSKAASESSATQGQYSNPIYLATTDRNQAATYNQRSTPTYSSNDNSSWQHVDSTQVQPSANCGSAGEYIPGLTLANNNAGPSAALSPFELLARQTSDILGGAHRY